MISDRFVTCLFDASDSYGEVVLTPQTADAYLSHAFGKEIRFLSFSASSDRCSPLLVLHTIGSGVLFKLAPSQRQLATDTRRLNSLHSSCLTESKTAVVPLEGGVEIHLVAMPVAQTQLENGGANACFWGFLVEEAMYASCLPLLNLRCLAMVLDLDETLIVANTMKTFDDRIDALTRRLQAGRDDSGQLLASLKRFQEDKAILEQYYKTDQVFNNGKLYKAQSEVVAPVVEGGMQITRPIIRLLEHNLILTRINPTVRDTSVLVRMRPAWDDLRNYLMAKKGRRRFEVFICTMSERDYALEMWRLLDPDARLINSVELNERVNCVKSDAKKSLKQVFPRHFCHPKMAMVIDDRLAVWEKPDQPRVHQVQAFQPYTTDPITETICDPPPLCIARNIACNVRAGFFKDLDEILTHQMADIRFDTDVTTLPNAPDVCNYMLPEKTDIDPDTRRRLLILQHGQDNLQKHRPQEEMFFEENRPGPDASVFSDDEDVGRPIQVNPPREHSFHASLLGANANNAVSTLHEFGQKVNAMVQYRTKLRTSSQLGFNVEIMFNGEKVGEGTGGTKKEANSMAAKDALNFLANESTNGRRVEPLSNSYSGPGDYGQPLHGRSLRDPRLRVGLEPVAMDDDTRSVASTSGHVRLGDNRSDVDDQTFNVVSALKELCTTEGINVQFRAMPSSGLGNHQAFHCHVDVAGRTLGKGSGVTWEAAKHQAAEEALRLLQTS
ncbi:unnamed protein product, partial [Sphagnum jensenii]